MPLQAWSVADVRAAEARAMALLPEGELMARAAQGLATVVSHRIAALATERTDHDSQHRDLAEATNLVVLIGPGDNGGDAAYAAAILARTHRNLRITCVLTFATWHQRGVQEAGLAGAQVVAVREESVDSSPDAAGFELAARALAQADVVVDGIAGIGGRSGLPEQVTRLLATMSPAAYVVAVDLPSGADPSGEQPPLECVQADETVTFGIAKPVHLLATWPACGPVSTVDIGLDLDALPAPSAERLVVEDIPALWPVPNATDDKYTRGVLGVVAGGESYPGAALLTVLSAACAGVGMVRYVGPVTPTALVRAAVPEAVHGWPTGSQRVQAWVVGPGLDVTDASDAGLAQVRAAREALETDLPCVVDAGGLELLHGPRPHAGARTLLTPHAAELARLLARLDAGPGGRAPDVDAVRRRPVASARRAAELLHATVLLKGATTFVVPPPSSGLPARAQADAPPWLATAGAGDVLAGLAGMLLASGRDPLDAGSLAALVHGLAAARVNPGGPIRASEVAHAIPATVASALAAGSTEG